MFMVFNKEKINSYIISIATVAFLFVVGFIITKDNTITTSANINEVTNIIQNEIIE